jgi:hypothetical protein
MAIISTTIASAQGVSSAFYLSPPSGLWSLHVPSMSGAAGAVRIQFATSSAGTDFAVRG